MASVPNTTKSGIGAGGVLVFLLAIALALGGHHVHMAASGSSGSGHVLPYLVGTTGDPCRDKPDSEVVRTGGPQSKSALIMREAMSRTGPKSRSRTCSLTGVQARSQVRAQRQDTRSPGYGLPYRPAHLSHLCPQRREIGNSVTQ
jgi:hypothetical protein